MNGLTVAFEGQSPMGRSSKRRAIILAILFFLPSCRAFVPNTSAWVADAPDGVWLWLLDGLNSIATDVVRLIL